VKRPAAVEGNGTVRLYDPDRRYFRNHFSYRKAVDWLCGELASVTADYGFTLSTNPNRRRHPQEPSPCRILDSWRSNGLPFASGRCFRQQRRSSAATPAKVPVFKAPQLTNYQMPGKRIFPSRFRNHCPFDVSPASIGLGKKPSR